MASAKEISSRIRGIQDTMKITKAMYMISSIKMRKAKQKLTDTEPYFYGLQHQIGSILYHFPAIESQYFDHRSPQQETRKKGFIIMSADKGMAGAYNHNIFKETERLVEEAGGNCELFVVGELGRQYLGAHGYQVNPQFKFTATNPTVHRARVITELIVEMYKQKELEEVSIVYTRMVNSMKSVVEVHQLLPLRAHEFVKNDGENDMTQAAIDARKSAIAYDKYAENGQEEEGATKSYASDFFIWPSPKKVLEQIVYNYVTGFVYGALVEASASEENARMTAMRSATDNAQDMLNQLSMEYNRVRQAAITQEITEVAAGAQALRHNKNK